MIVRSKHLNKGSFKKIILKIIKIEKWKVLFVNNNNRKSEIIRI